jgi:hypothetical protein
MNCSQKTVTSITLLIVFLVGTILGQTGHGYDLASIDKNTPACTDFYQYANAGKAGDPMVRKG